MQSRKGARLKLSDHFNTGRLLRFALPSVIMLICTSVYTIVDGVFVSNCVGDAAFAGLNLIFPVLTILGSVGMMFGAGGSAIIARTLGEGKPERANGYFTLFLLSIAILGVILGVIAFFLMPLFAQWLGTDATPATVAAAELYGKVYVCGLPFYMLQYAFQSFFVTAEKSRLGFLLTVVAGLVNVALDALFIMGFSWGLAGAAAATVCGQVVCVVAALVYFARRNDSLLRITRPVFSLRSLLHACANGSSELLTNISAAVVAMLYNTVLLRLAGDLGVIAYGVIMYVNMIYLGVFYGFALGVAPIISYHYGAGDREELKGLFRRSLVIYAVAGVVLTVLAEALSLPCALIFVHGEEAIAFTKRAMQLYSFAYLLMGFNMFASAFFTALGNGGVSALLSFLRTLVLECGAVIIFSASFGLTGVWLAIVAAEGCALACSVLCWLACGRRYGYLGREGEKVALRGAKTVEHIDNGGTR